MSHPGHTITETTATHWFTEHTPLLLVALTVTVLIWIYIVTRKEETPHV